MTRSSKIWIWVLLAVLLIGLGVGGYYLFKPTETKKTQDVFKFSTNSWIGTGPMFLAKEKGFFGDVDVQISMMDDQAQRTAAITKGDIDAYVDTVDLFVVTKSNNVPTVTVMKADASNGADGIIVSNSIKSIKDLKGKKIAVQKNFVGESFLTYELRKNGMSLNDVTEVDMESGAAGAAFLSGSVDAAVTFEPWLSKAKERADGKVLVSSADEPDVLVDTIAVNDTYLKNNPATVQKVINGWLKAIDYWKANPDDANAIMAAAYKLQPSEFADMITGLKWANKDESLQYFEKDGQPGKFYEVANTFSDAFLDNGTISAKPDLTQYVDLTFLKNASN